MPDFETVSLEEAQRRTIAGRQGRFINEYAQYIQQLSQGQAGRLHIFENENPLTIRRRLSVAAQTLGTKLIIKRSGVDVYFWTESSTEEQPRQRWGRRRRSEEETAGLDQPLIEPEEVNRGVTEESPELGQT